MRIAEYKQIDTETIENVVLVDDYDEEGNIVGQHEETVTKTIPIMGMVYRDATTEELVESQKTAFIPQSAELSTEEKLELMLESVSVEKPTGTTENNELPFKLGYIWQPVYDGNKFAWNLVPDPNAIGTQDNPIYYAEDVPLIDNAYYMIDGVRKVYMSGQFIEF